MLLAYSITISLPTIGTVLKVLGGVVVGAIIGVVAVGRILGPCLGPLWR